MNDKYKDISSNFLLGHFRIGKASGQGLSQVQNYEKDKLSEINCYLFHIRHKPRVGTVT